MTRPCHRGSWPNEASDRGRLTLPLGEGVKWLQVVTTPPTIRKENVI